MGEIHLNRCTPTPLASYLKALAVLRLVAEQKDPDARGRWDNDHFVLHTELDAHELTEFFTHEYAPSALTAPWNGGSGFYPKDKKAKRAIAPIVESTHPRFGPIKAVLVAAQAAVDRLGLDAKPDTETKEQLLELCRGTFPDHALTWLDAVFLLSTDGPKYPPLLGTGGNDGRLEFTSNFMERLGDLISPSGEPTAPSEALLRSALFGDASDGLTNASIGQFLPEGAGGPNLASDYDGDAAFNPWDYVLAFEGALLFAVGSSRRLETDRHGSLAYPFSVRAVGAGYGTAALADEDGARAEIWLPLWTDPAGLNELRHLFAEGRARISGRTARNGVDFARAIATLGVDRGLNEFQRYAFLVRNGLSYLATPVGRFRASSSAEPNVLRLGELDQWLDKLRRSAGSDNAPASVRRALRRLEGAILGVCQTPKDTHRLTDLFIALGKVERTLASGSRWLADSGLTPIPPIDPSWLLSLTPSPELRLAAAAASTWSKGTTQIRAHFEPVAYGGGERRWARFDDTRATDVVWREGSLTSSSNALVSRRILESKSNPTSGGVLTFRDTAAIPAPIGDVVDFIDGNVDERLIVDLLWSTLLIDWRRWNQLDAGPWPLGRPEHFPQPTAMYSLLRSCYPGVRSDPSIPVDPTIHRLAANGHGDRASKRAVRRLRGSGLTPLMDVIGERGASVQRAAAALVFPIGSPALQRINRRILAGAEPESDASHSSIGASS